MRIHYPALGVFLLAAVSIAGVVSYAPHLSFGVSFLITAGAILANGLLATLEDDLPGGFNNPNGTNTPAYARVVSWFFRAAFAAAAFAGATVFGLVAYSQDGAARAGAAALLAATCLLAPAAVFWHHRGALWGAAACFVLAFAVAYALAS